MKITPYLNFDGQCAEAFRFYEQVLGGKIEAMSTYDKSPMAEQVPPGWESRVLHTTLRIGDQLLMGADSLPGQHQKAQGISVSLHIDDPSEAERTFHALAEGGTATLPIQETFWAKRFGMLVDKFGIPWMINCE